MTTLVPRYQTYLPLELYCGLGVSMLRVVSAVCWLLMTYSFGSPRSVARGEDRKESAGSTIIFSDLKCDGGGNFRELERSVETPKE